MVLSGHTTLDTRRACRTLTFDECGIDGKGVLHIELTNVEFSMKLS